MPQDSKDLELTHAEKDMLDSVLAGITNFSAEGAFHAVNDTFYFIPQQVCTSPDAVLALAKYVLAHP